METYGNVQQKIPCVFQTIVVEESSTKRSHQPYKVVASEHLRSDAKNHNIIDSHPSEKVDGTCVFIEEFDGKPWLWARLDRKPNKAADKRFRKYQNSKNSQELAGSKTSDLPLFEWDPFKDFKEIPENWIPAKGVQVNDGIPYPDENGHIPGWVPIDPNSRQHLWHLAAVDLHTGKCLVLQPDVKNQDVHRLCIKAIPLSDFLGCTMELIGTNVNGNPYHMGSKQSPLHLLVRHGFIAFTQKPPLVFSELKQWFEQESEGQVEGVVWHCEDGTLFKVHRHHLGLSWPVTEPLLSIKSVCICIDLGKYENNSDEKSQFNRLGQRCGEVFDSIRSMKQI